MRRREGFTLLEVMVAVFILGIAIGALMQYLQQHLVNLGAARREIEGAALVEEKLRELQLEIEEGGSPEVSSDQGEFDEPYDYLRWVQVVEPETIPLPDGTTGPPPSTIFAAQTLAPQTVAVQPSILRVSVRVFHESVEDPESVPPYVLYIVQPPDDAEFERLEQQQGQEELEQPTPGGEPGP